MKLENLCERFLTEKQWRFVELTRDVLEPFMLVQRLLEAEKYVTSSVVAFVIFALKQYLEEAIDKYDSVAEERRMDDEGNVHEPDAIKDKLMTTVKAMKADFDIRFGSDPSKYSKLIRVGNSLRPQGIHPFLLLASLLDPRYKTMPMIPLAAQERTWDLLKFMVMNEAECE
eukprot:TRINITY_DN4206_c0_g1_i6.p1 TRINITY_DN4206_c0_g1~~TRINITY_DN4206_c0_g1_i6.p1  ORF type:complete len:171 (-),score=44.89 TRINITY_DN4206_c0_g1_i6:281-793(-)